MYNHRSPIHSAPHLVEISASKALLFGLPGSSCSVSCNAVFYTTSGEMWVEIEKIALEFQRHSFPRCSLKA
jgi:hypothetical protein